MKTAKKVHYKDQFGNSCCLTVDAITDRQAVDEVLSVFSRIGITITRPHVRGPEYPVGWYVTRAS